MNTQLHTREALFETVAQIAAERAAAKPIVERLLAHGAEEAWDEKIPDEWRTAGFVQELSAAAEELDEPDPPRSLSLHQLALAVATSIRKGTYPSPVQAVVEGRVWKDIGWVHLHQNAHEAALRAFEAGQRSFAPEPALGHDEARIKLASASPLIFTRRNDDALRMIEESTEVFRTFGDERHVVMAQSTKALMHLYSGEYDVACAEYEELLSNIQNMDDLRWAASVYNNLRDAYAALGRTSDAVVALHRARELHTELGVPTDKTDWGLAHVLLATGEFNKAVTLLRRLRENFLAKQMPEDAGVVALEIVEALIALGEHDEARTLTQQVLTEFRNASLNDQAITALAYLRDFLRTTREPRRAVRHVRSYVERLRSEPARLFLPLEDNDRYEERSEPPVEIPEETTTGPEIPMPAGMSAAEDAAAEPRAKELVAMSPEERSNLLRQHAEWRTAGLVRKLIEAVDDINLSAPKDASEITALVVDVAESLEPGNYPFEVVMKLRASAWRERAYALYYIGSFGESLSALDRTDSLLRKCAVSELDFARSRLVRALVYREMDRLDEAIALADSAQAIFRRFGDVYRQAAAHSTKAVMLMQARRFPEALAIHQSILGDPRIDETSRALALHHAGMCCRELSQLERAKEFFAKAIVEFERLGLIAVRAKARWQQAIVLVAECRHEEALGILMRLRSKFEELGMAQDAALVSIDAAEVLLILNRMTEVVQFCQAAIEYFSEAGLANTEGALTALAYLQEAANPRALALAEAKDVRAAFEVIRTQPSLVFARLDDGCHQQTTPAVLPGRLIRTLQEREYSHHLGHEITEEAAVATEVRSFVTYDAEDASAEPRAKQLLEVSAEERGNLLRQHPEWRTAGLVQKLISAVDEVNFSAPKAAAEITALAADVAESLEPANYPNDVVMKLRASAWRERGFALFITGSYRESLAALDNAKDRLASAKIADFDRARVDVVCAYVFRELDRIDESIALARSAAEVFTQFGDRNRYAIAEMARASSLLNARRSSESAEIFLHIAELAGIDDTTRACALNNAANCYRELGRYEEAKGLFVRAVLDYERLGLSALRARARWNLAGIFVREHRFEEGLALMTELRQESQQFGMAWDVACLSVEMAEVLLALGRPADVVELCRSAMEYFKSERLEYTEGALTALAYLREAAEQRTLTLATVKQVRTSLDKLPRQPNLMFAQLEKL